VCAEELAREQLSEACFGLCAAHKVIDMAFPMRDATPAKLFSLFGDLRATGHGTRILFTSRTDEHGVPVVAPSPDGRSVCAGGVELCTYLAREWWLPPSARLPWEQDIGLRAARAGTQMPFKVVLCGPAGSTDVDFSEHPWERVVAAGQASPPRTLEVRHGDIKSILHYRLGWAHADDAGDAGIYLHRHPRFACKKPLPHTMGGGAATAARRTIESGGRDHFTAAHGALLDLYGGRFPVSEKQDMRQLTSASCAQ
jgi:hypothetical protein